MYRCAITAPRVTRTITNGTGRAHKEGVSSYILSSTCACRVTHELATADTQTRVLPRPAGTLATAETNK